MGTAIRALAAAGLAVQDIVHDDVTFLVPPLDRVARRVMARYRDEPWEPTISRGGRRYFGTASMVLAGPS